MKKRIGLIAGVSWFLVAPPLIKGYFLEAATVFCYDAILAISFRWITIMGRWSLAHVALMSVGAYTSALLSSKYLSLPFWLTLPLGGLAAAFVAFLISFPCLRVKGFYFFLSTFAAGEAIRQCYIRFHTPFRGLEGIGGIIRPNPIVGISFTDPVSFYYLALAFAALSGFILYWLERGRLGNIAKAIASNDDLMESIGVNTWRYQSAFFIIGSFFAGIAGALQVHYLGFVSPVNFATMFMFNVLIWNAIGGTTTFVGPLIGLGAVTAYTEALRDMVEWVPFISGFILLLTLLFLPGGLESLPRIVRRSWARIVRKQ